MKEIKILIKAEGGLISRFSMKVGQGMIISILEITEQKETENPEWDLFMGDFRENMHTYVRSPLADVLDWADWYKETFAKYHKLPVHVYFYEGEIPVFYGNFKAYFN